jgi:plasmid stabilization system protein ParE
LMYRIEITPGAQADADEAYAWMLENVSPAHAERWYQDLFAQIDSLKTFPGRCPVAPESRNFAEEIRELIFGKRKHKNKYRILFAIRQDSVAILYVYHGSRKEIEP